MEETVCRIEDPIYNPQLRSFEPFGHPRLTADANARLDSVLMPYWIDECRARYSEERKAREHVDLGGEAG